MLKSTLSIATILLAVQCTFAQTTYEYRKPATEKAIPKLVVDAFKEQYPDVLVRGWYITHITYWQNDVSSGWYNNWYGERTMVIYTYEKPNHFEVEFTSEPGELSRAIYNRYGYWYETRTKMRGFPMAINEAINQSKYVGWKKSMFVERLESNGWPDSIYRFSLSKGLKRQIIRMNSKGDIVQSKDISED